MNEVIARRFKELEIQRQRTAWQKQPGSDALFVPNGQWQGWATSALSLIRAAFGESSDQYENFSTMYKKCHGHENSVRTLHHLFINARDDFEGGYVFNLELQVSGAVFGDFVELARTALQGGHKDVAAVLSCAALEDALKRFAIANKLEVQDKSMADVVNALKGAGLVAGAQKTLLDRMPTIRNYALHANWDKISEPDVGSVIGFVEQFLLKNFSN